MTALELLLRERLGIAGEKASQKKKIENQKAKVKSQKSK
jgi:hypothetical protein